MFETGDGLSKGIPGIRFEKRATESTHVPNTVSRSLQGEPGAMENPTPHVEIDELAELFGGSEVLAVERRAEVASALSAEQKAPRGRIARARDGAFRTAS
jgi:hypothetical protein